MTTGPLYELVIEGSAEVIQFPNCPVCGEEGCEIVHTATEESTQ